MYKNFLSRFQTFLASPLFFRIIVGTLVASAAWIALTGKYPMAFDEDFHFGIIRLYAEHPSPFWHAHPAGADAFGAVARDPSYLFHYIMSFPYRLTDLFTDNMRIQVIVLRAINIALFASCLPLFRRLLLRTGASKALVHGCLALFVLIPISPLLAAQINYDNLILPLTALLLLKTLQFGDGLKKRHVDGVLLVECLALGLAGSLIKFAFLPIFLSVLIFMAGTAYWAFGRRRLSRQTLKQELKTIVSTRRGKVLAILTVLLLLLSFERYGLNIIRYHDPVPACGKVLSVSQCSSYGPWIRDYDFAATKPPGHANPVSYTKEWFYGMWLRSFFALDGPSTDFQTRGPLFMPGVSAIILFGIGCLAILRYGRKVWRAYDHQALALFSIVSVLYVLALWREEFKAYAHTGMPVAINGRYLLPILLLGMIIAALAISQALRRRPTAKRLFILISIVCFLWGGGALTYILRSNDAWYWPGSVVRMANRALIVTLGPVTPGYYRPQAFLK